VISLLHSGGVLGSDLNRSESSWAAGFPVTRLEPTVRSVPVN